MAEEEKEKLEKSEKKATKEAKLVEVPTQFGLSVELEDGTKVDDLQLLVKIYNKLLKIEKSVA